MNLIKLKSLILISIVFASHYKQIEVMITTFPISFNLKDGTQVKVYREENDRYEFYLTRLNSEKHNFMLVSGKIEESYETRFDELQQEAVSLFEKMRSAGSN